MGQWNRRSAEGLQRYAEELLRDMFRELWEERNSPWTSGEECGERLKHDLQPTAKKRNLVQKQWELIQKGNIDFFDTTLLANILVGGWASCPTNALQERSRCAAQSAREFRNYLAHNRTPSDRELQAEAEKLASVLLEHAKASRDHIAKIRESHIDSADVIQRPTANDDDNARCEALRRAATELWQKKLYDEARHTLDEAVLISGAYETTRAKVHRDRSEVAMAALWPQAEQLSLLRRREIAQRPLSDAEMACKLEPRWDEAYLQRARVHERLEDFQRASISYALAKELSTAASPTYKEATDGAKRMKEQRAREQNGEFRSREYDAGFSHSRNMEELAVRSQQDPSTYDPIRMMQRLAMDSQDDSSAGNELFRHAKVQEGHRAQAERDIQRAANAFKDAAERGSPDGMYSLYLLNAREGDRFVSRESALAWCRKAAECDPVDSLTGNRAQGVAEALHAMAGWHLHGTHVEKDLFKALTLYERAARQLFPASINSLGWLYGQNLGVEYDAHRHFELCRMAAILGDGNAMQNVALCYMNGIGHCKDLRRAQIWMEASVQCGNDDARLAAEQLRGAIPAANQALEQREDVSPHLAAQLADLEQCARNLREAQHYRPREDCAPKVFGAEQIQEMLACCGEDSYDGEHAEVLASILEVRDLLPLEERARRLRSLLEIDDASMLLCFAKTPELISFIEANAETNDDAAMLKAEWMQGSRLAQIQYIDVLLQRVTDSAFLHARLAALHSFPNVDGEETEDFEQAYRLFKCAIHLAPSHAGNVYMLAACCRKFGRIDEAKQLYKEFIKLAPRKHRKLPEAYYGLAEIAFSKTEFESPASVAREVLHLMNRGDTISAEVTSPLSVPSNVRTRAYNSLRMMNTALKLDISLPPREQPVHHAARAGTTLHPWDTLDVSALIRRQIVKQIRKEQEKRYLMQLRESELVEFSFSATGRHPVPAHRFAAPVHGEEISVEEMHAKRQDAAFENFIVRGRVVSSLLHMQSVMFCLRDEEGMYIKVAVYNMPGSMRDWSEQLRFGRSISIRSPYYRFAADDTNMIRVDDPSTITFGEYDDFCWTCVQKIAEPKRCTACKTATYCGKECQKRDWDELGHKAECKWLWPQ